MVQAFIRTHDFLHETISKNSDDWKWKHVHSQMYPSLPWSRTPLKFLFHREVPVGGNMNTPGVSKYYIKQASDQGNFNAVQAGGYKHLIEMGDKTYTGSKHDKLDDNLYSIDTGNNGNIFMGNYFTMNRNHLDGKLHSMYIGDQINLTPTHELKIVPAKQEDN